jgi:RNA polymerase sigma-70 factor (ECF subfamily)
MQILHDRDTVEDLVQDFFVSLWADAPGRPIQSSLKSYLFAGVKNRCLDYRKHQKVDHKYRKYIFFSALNNENSTESFLAESELRHAVENCIEKLPPRCREIFEMSRLKGLSNQDIAVELGLSKRTVELQISNALKMMRKELVEYLPAFLIALLVL